MTEMFMAQADNKRCFFGCIKRLKDEHGHSFVFSRIVIHDGLLCAKADDQKELGKNLDEIVIMILDMELHSYAAAKTKIFDNDFFLN